MENILPPVAGTPSTRRTNGWQVCVNGLWLAARYWQALLAFYIVITVTAFLLSVLPALALLGPAHYTALKEAANGIPAWMVIDWIALSGNQGNGNGAAVSQLNGMLQGVLPLIILDVLLLPLLAWLPANALSGGLLLAYAEAPKPFGWRRFAWGCWNWLGVFLTLGLAEGILTLAAILLLSILVGLATGLGPAWLAVGILLLALLLAAGGLALVEMTRVCAVSSGTHNLFRAFGQAVSFAWRRPLDLGGLYLLALLGLLGLHGLFRLGLFPHLPLAFWPLVLFVQQAFVILRLWARAGRYAAGTELIKT